MRRKVGNIPRQRYELESAARLAMGRATEDESRQLREEALEATRARARLQSGGREHTRACRCDICWRLWSPIKMDLRGGKMRQGRPVAVGRASSAQEGGEDGAPSRAGAVRQRLDLVDARPEELPGARRQEDGAAGREERRSSAGAADSAGDGERNATHGGSSSTRHPQQRPALVGAHTAELAGGRQQDDQVAGGEDGERADSERGDDAPQPGRGKRKRGTQPQARAENQKLSRPHSQKRSEVRSSGQQQSQGATMVLRKRVDGRTAPEGGVT